MPRRSLTKTFEFAIEREFAAYEDELGTSGEFSFEIATKTTFDSGYVDVEIVSVEGCLGPVPPDEFEALLTADELQELQNVAQEVEDSGPDDE